VHAPRQKAFAGPSLTLNQDRRHPARALMALQKCAHHLPDDLRIFSDQVVEGVHAGGMVLRRGGQRVVNCRS
jgi:hypothetical protein